MKTILDTKEGRTALASALTWAAQEFVEEQMIADMARLADEPIRSCFAAIVDPEKLAKLLVGEGRRLGLSCGLRLRVHVKGEPLVYDWEFLHFPNEASPLAKQAIGVCPHYSLGARNYDLTMPQARVLLAAWLGLPDGASEDAERALRCGA